MLIYLIIDSTTLDILVSITQLFHIFDLLVYGWNPDVLAFKALSEDDAHLFAFMEERTHALATAVGSLTAYLNWVL